MSKHHIMCKSRTLDVPVIITSSIDNISELNGLEGVNNSGDANNGETLPLNNTATSKFNKLDKGKHLFKLDFLKSL